MCETAKLERSAEAYNLPLSLLVGYWLHWFRARLAGGWRREEGAGNCTEKPNQRKPKRISTGKQTKTPCTIRVKKHGRAAGRLKSWRLAAL